MEELKEVSGSTRLSYPLRPQRQDNRRFSTIPLVSNHYWVRFEPTHKIFIYFIDFEPRIGADVRSLKQRLFSCETVVKALTNEIGFYILTGSTLFGAKSPKFEDNIAFPVSFEDKDYSIKVSLRRSFPISDVFSDDKKVSSAAFKFFNIIVKNNLRSMKLLEFGRTSRFFNLEKSATLADTNLRIFHGYFTSFSHYESGFYFKIDLTHKIIRTDTVLNFIDDLYIKNKELPKDEKRKKIKEILVGKSVLAMYGNYRYWRVDDIIFDKDCDTFEFEDESSKVQLTGPEAEQLNLLAPKKMLNLTQYYKERYNMKLLKPKQPLILNIQSKTGKMFYIIPEFCVMTGIPEDASDFTRKKVTESCIKQPQERMKEVQNLIESMLRSTSKQEYPGGREIPSYQSYSLSAMKDLGIEFQRGPVTFDGKIIPPPKILVGSGGVADIRNGNFQVRKDIYNPGNEILAAILCPREFKADRLIEQFDSLARSFAIKWVEPRVFDYGRKEEGRKAIIELQSLLESKIPGKYDIVIIILPNNMKLYYSQIKQQACLTLGILTQVLLYNTLEKKGFYQICSKILLQIACKVGSTLWVAQPPKEIYKHTMLIGIDASPDKIDKNKNAIAFCATIDRTFTRYYNRVIYQKKSEDSLTSMKILIRECIMAYQKMNENNLPQHIIILRGAVNENSEREIQTKEVNDIKETFAEYTNQQVMDPTITIITIDKRISQRFFGIGGNKQLENPPAGTLVDNTIASKYYDFYLIAQNVNRGTATPTHYKIIYDNSKLSAENLQELLYSQCFAYANWSGSVKVPAPCQYAQKLSKFVSQNMNDEPVKQLRTNLYYL